MNECRIKAFVVFAAAVASSASPELSARSGRASTNSADAPPAADRRCDGRRILVNSRRSFLLDGPAPPPLTLPADLHWAYTRCGAIPVESFYVNDLREGSFLPIRYNRDRLDELISSARRLVQHPNPLAYGKNGWLAASLRRHEGCITNKRTAVIGSMTPITETLLLAAGASHVTTVEYNLNLSYAHPAISTVDPDAFASDDFAGVSAVFSMSSYDHDGLGRYGDPIAPDGDLLSLSALRLRLLSWSLSHSGDDGGASSCLTPILFLTVPIGPDVIVWNLHRRYGRVRLPLLLAGWEVLDSEGWDPALVDAPASYTKTHEPVLVLRPVPPAADQSADEAADAIHRSVSALFSKRRRGKKTSGGNDGKKAKAAPGAADDSTSSHGEL